MALGRKAVFFSMTSLLIVGAMLVMFAPEDQRTIQDATYDRIQDLTQDRIQLEERVVPIVLRSYIRRSLDHIAQSGTGGTLVDTLNDCLHTNDQEGKCAGRTQEETFGATISEIEETYLDALQHDVEITLNNLTRIEHISPWELTVTANVTVHVNDTANFARYKNTKLITTTVSIQNLIDPLSTAERPGTTHRIRRDTSNNWTAQTLKNHAANGTYVYNNESPSYLQRLAMQRTDSEFGIHSLVPNTDDNISAADYDDTDYNADCLLDITLDDAGTIRLTEELAEFYRVFDRTGETGYDPEAC